MKSIVFTGGGTAGHIMPNLAIIADLKNKYKIYYIGSSGMEKDIILKQKNIEFIEIPVVKFQRSLSPKNFLIPFKLLSSIKQTKKILQKIQPCLIFSKGGYVSIPTSLAGKKLNIPVITHESDLTIGLANKLIAKKSKYLCCSFKTTADNYGKNAIFTGSPIRSKIFTGNKNKITNQLNINNEKPTILIVGGSQGARTINSVIFENIDKLINKYNIIHIVGRNNLRNIKYNGYYQIEFANNIEDYFSASDIVISRAGSNTIFELLALAKPMILIPLPKTKHSRGDQIDNANYFKSNGYAQIIEQDNLNYKSLQESINDILINKNQFVSNMKNASNTTGNKKIIELIEKTIK